MVVTSSTAKFKTDNRGTDWFIVHISSAQPESGNLRRIMPRIQAVNTQKVVRYGISQIPRRNIAYLKRP